jgi:hypothetical protein
MTCGSVYEVVRWQMDLVTSKCKVAALTLVTLPTAIWYVVDNPDTHISKLAFLLGFSPLFVGAGTELYCQWKAVWDNWGNAKPHVVGSPTGNKIAVILGLTLLGLVVFLAYVGATRRT